MRRRALQVGVVLTLSVALATHEVLAEEPPRDPASAEQLFEAAKKLWTEGDFDAACERFTASFGLDPSASTGIKIARCHERENKLATALADYQLARKLAAESPRPTHRQALLQLIDEAIAALEPRVPRLVVRLDPAPADAVVRRDGLILPAASLGESLPCDVGTRLLQAEAAGFVSAQSEVAVAEGERREVTLRLEPVPVAPPVPSETEAAPVRVATAPVRAAMPVPEPDRVMQTVGFSLGGGGVALLGAAGALGIATLVKVGASTDHCNALDQCDPVGLRLRGEASDLQTAGLILAGTGVAALGTGLALVLLGSTDDGAAGVGVALQVGPTALAVGGRW